MLAVVLGWFLFRGLTKPLVNLARTAVRIAGGELEQPFVAQGSDEIARLAKALEHMRQELRAKLDLVAHQAAQLQVSSQRIVAAQDEERRRLARDLHDGIQQQLVVLRLRLGLGQEASGHGVDAGLLADLGGELDHTIASLREVSHDLYPAILRDRGLAAAVRSYAGRIPVPSTLAVEPDPLPRISPDVESAAYFLLCEAVTNIIKHAQANDIAMSISVAGDHLTLRVADDGRGFDNRAGGRRGGLLHMDDRVRSFGGTLDIQSEPGAGTTVVASFPLTPPDDEESMFARPEPPDPFQRPPESEQPVVAVSPSGAGGRTAQPQPGGSYPGPR
ncbi:MAG: HAMP domain-containing protein [Actinobacteria bacterium]|nr:HAMP domain-containing protein [Actinomycetota bacterium]